MSFQNFQTQESFHILKFYTDCNISNVIADSGGGESGAQGLCGTFNRAAFWVLGADFYFRDLIFVLGADFCIRAV